MDDQMSLRSYDASRSPMTSDLGVAASADVAYARTSHGARSSSLQGRQSYMPVAGAAAVLKKRSIPTAPTVKVDHHQHVPAVSDTTNDEATLNRISFIQAYISKLQYESSSDSLIRCRKPLMDMIQQLQQLLLEEDDGMARGKKTTPAKKTMKGVVESTSASTAFDPIAHPKKDDAPADDIWSTFGSGKATNATDKKAKKAVIEEEPPPNPETPAKEDVWKAFSTKATIKDRTCMKAKEVSADEDVEQPFVHGISRADLEKKKRMTTSSVPRSSQITGGDVASELTGVGYRVSSGSRRHHETVEYDSPSEQSYRHNESVESPSVDGDRNARKYRIHGARDVAAGALTGDALTVAALKNHDSGASLAPRVRRKTRSKSRSARVKEVEKIFQTHVVPSMPMLRDVGSENMEKGSLNDPKLLEKVEDAIRRLILPELQAIKSEQESTQLGKVKRSARPWPDGKRPWSELHHDDSVAFEMWMKQSPEGRDLSKVMDNSGKDDSS